MAPIKKLLKNMYSKPSKKPLLLRYEIIIILIVKLAALSILWWFFFSDTHRVHVNTSLIKQHIFNTTQDNAQ